MRVVLRSRGVEPVSPRPEPMGFRLYFLPPCHATDTILRAPCVVALTSKCTPLFYLCFLIFCRLFDAMRRGHPLLLLLDRKEAMYAFTYPHTLRLAQFWLPG